MGIYDRDYYRREGPSFLGSLAQQGRVTTWLIGLNLLCFLIQFATRTADDRLSAVREPFTQALALDIVSVKAGEVWRLLTYSFLHDTHNIFHLVFNMLFLFWFGRQVEETVGSVEFLLFYLGSATFSGAVFFFAALGGFHGINPSCIGASGAVTAVLVLAAMINPRQTIYLFFVIPVPIWAFAVFMVIHDLIPFMARESGQVATSAHLGGAAFALAYRLQGWQLSGLVNWWKAKGKKRAEPRLRLYREEENEPHTPVTALQTQRPAPTRSATSTGPRQLIDDEQLDAQLDTILAKISREGMDGLTREERETLTRASEAIKRRRS